MDQNRKELSKVRLVKISFDVQTIAMSVVVPITILLATLSSYTTLLIQPLQYCTHIISGFMTAKGKLVRSIMHPAPVDFKFEQDSYKFVTFLASIAFVGFAYTAINLVGSKRG